MRREKLTYKIPLHVTVRITSNKPSLRDRKMHLAFLRAISRAKDYGLAVQHFSVIGNHIHFLVEVENNESLARGMMSLLASMTWATRKILRVGGKLFAGRFHTHVLKAPTEVRNAIK